MKTPPGYGLGYDDDLSWPLIADVTITLLNQLEDKNHYSKMAPVNVEHYGNVLIEYPTFILHSELGFNPVRNTQYLKDDALYFRGVCVCGLAHKGTGRGGGNCILSEAEEHVTT